jgi:hypothetical protein
MRSGGTDPFILNPGIIQRKVAAFTPLKANLEKEPCY